MHSVHKMPPIVKDGVAWSDCLLVPFVIPAKKRLIQMPFGGQTHVVLAPQFNHVYRTTVVLLIEYSTVDTQQPSIQLING